MVHTTAFTFLTSEYNQYIVITDKVRQVVRECGVRDGMVTVLSKHTTAGIMTNESLECLESDIDVFLKRLVPEDYPIRMRACSGTTVPRRETRLAI